MKKYELSVVGHFSAQHALRQSDGHLEEQHPHDWSLRVWISSSQLNHWDVIMDFVDLQKILDRTLARFDGTVLNECEEMADINPSVERVSEFFYYAIRKELPAGVDLDRIVLRRTGGMLPEAEYVFSDS